MTRALEQLDDTDDDDQLARLSPTLHAHVCPHGAYRFDPDSVPAEGLRPLRDPRPHELPLTPMADSSRMLDLPRVPRGSSRRPEPRTETGSLSLRFRRTTSYAVSAGSGVLPANLAFATRTASGLESISR